MILTQAWGRVTVTCTAAPGAAASRPESRLAAQKDVTAGSHAVAVRQFVPLAESALSGALVHIPSDIYDLDPDWEIDPDSLQLMGKLGAPQPDPEAVQAKQAPWLFERWSWRWWKWTVGTCG